MSTSEEFNARMADLEKRLDRMANVNEYLVARQEQAWSALRKLETSRTQHLETLISMDESQARLDAAMNRLDSTLLGVVERVEMLGGSFGVVYDELIAHLRKGHGPTGDRDS